jgi:Tfp pilus assembly protein PilF
MATPTAAPEESQGAKPKAQPRPVAPQLSAAQRAAIADRLTIGRFLMDRKDYSAAIKEFQAALAIDPTSREAQAAIQQARVAGTN